MLFLHASINVQLACPVIHSFVSIHSIKILIKKKREKKAKNQLKEKEKKKGKKNDEKDKEKKKKVKNEQKEKEKKKKKVPPAEKY